MIEVIRESRAPADRLWEVMSDVRQWPRWLPTVDAVIPSSSFTCFWMPAFASQTLLWAVSSLESPHPASTTASTTMHPLSVLIRAT